MPPTIGPELKAYRSYALTEEGWARAHELETE
jgi:hypothetical protein